MRTIQQTASFGRAIKKLHANQKTAFREELKKVQENPFQGEEKRGDLTGVWVHKYKVKTQQYLLAYVFDDNSLTFIYFGAHENFYRAIKR